MHQQYKQVSSVNNRLIRDYNKGDYQTKPPGMQASIFRRKNSGDGRGGGTS